MTSHMHNLYKPNPNPRISTECHQCVMAHSLDLSHRPRLRLHLLQKCWTLLYTTHCTSILRNIFTLTTVLIFLFPLVALSRQRLSAAVSMALEGVRGLGLSRPSSTWAAQRHVLKHRIKRLKFKAHTHAFSHSSPCDVCAEDMGTLSWHNHA